MSLSGDTLSLFLDMIIDWEWVRTVTVCVIALGMIIYLLKELWGWVMTFFEFLKLCLDSWSDRGKKK